MSSPVGFAVLGCGGIGRWHARQLQSLPETRLVRMVDPDQGARERAARLFGVPVVTEPTAVLADATIEVVSICTPPATHAELAHAVVAAGKHVLIEKPLALTAAEGRQVTSACADAGVTLAIVHQQRTQPACRALKRLLAEDSLGRPVHAIGSLSWYRPSAAVADHAWRSRDRGGGSLLDAGVHLIDLLLWLLGPVIWVSAHRGDGDAGSDRDRTVAALLGFASDVTAVLTVSFAGNLYRDELTLEIVATRGGCRLEIRDHDHAEIARLDRAAADGDRASPLSVREIEAMVRHENGTWRAGPRHLGWSLLANLLPAERGRLRFASPLAYLGRRVDRVAQRETGQHQGHAAVLADMARAVRSGGAPLVGGGDACAGLAVIEAIEASIADTGRRVRIGLD